MAWPFRAYFAETRRPVYSAALLFPFFVLYHLGTCFLGTTYLNGADALIVRLLSLLSVHSMFASALVLLFCFVLWQVKTRSSWKIEPAKVAALFLESCFFAFLLFLLTGWLSVRLRLAVPGAAASGVLERLVLYCGAGIYEELVFRGFLLGSLWLILTGPFGMKKVPAAAAAALIAAFVFSAFHYVGPAGDTFTIASFLQRCWGGLFFSVLFVTRGFGVTAASHALYDILVGLILA